jgi:hypothetical protein
MTGNDNKDDHHLRIVGAALEWHAWAAAHSDSVEGNLARDTVLYRVVSEYRASLLDEHTRLWADEIRNADVDAIRFEYGL